MRTMFDSVVPGHIPTSLDPVLVAGYVDGLYANVPAMRSRFPHATVVEIAVRPSTNAGVVLDVETGDATPAQAPGWVSMRRKAGVDPTVYCNSSTWSAVRKAFRTAGVAEPHYWIAGYGNPPDTSIPSGAVAHQYTDHGDLYDISSVADHWPGVDTQPTKESFTVATADDAKTLWETDGLIPAPTAPVAAADAKTNKTWKPSSALADTQQAAREANANTAALLTQVAALKAELDAVKTAVSGLANPAGFAAQVLAEVKAGLSEIKFGELES